MWKDESRCCPMVTEKREEYKKQDLKLQPGQGVCSQRFIHSRFTPKCRYNCFVEFHTAHDPNTDVDTAEILAVKKGVYIMNDNSVYHTYMTKTYIKKNAVVYENLIMYFPLLLLCVLFLQLFNFSMSWYVLHRLFDFANSNRFASTIQQLALVMKNGAINYALVLRVNDPSHCKRIESKISAECQMWCHRSTSCNTEHYYVNLRQFS